MRGGRKWSEEEKVVSCDQVKEIFHPQMSSANRLGNP